MTFEVPIERGKIREFAKAAQSTNPAYDGPCAVIPPTFLTTAGLAWRPPTESLGGLAFDLRRVLHAEEEYVFHGPLPCAGETLTASTRLGDQFEKTGKRGGRMRFAVVITEYRGPDGQLVAEQRGTLVETEQPPAGGQ